MAEKFNPNKFYTEMFRNYLLANLLKPVIMIAIIKAYSIGHDEGYKTGKRVESIRYKNWRNYIADKLLKRHFETN